MVGDPAEESVVAPRGGAALRRLLLDTTFLIDAERGSAAGDVLADDDDVAIAAVTLAELWLGVELATNRHRGAREAYVEEIVATIPVVTYDARVAAAHARLLADVRRAGRPRGAHDLIIAATAVATQRTVVTRDTAGFLDLSGVDVMTPP